MPPRSAFHIFSRPQAVILPLLFSALASIACGYATVSYDSPQDTPIESDLVGKWSSDNCFGLEDRFNDPIQGWPCSWSLNQDHTFTMTDVPEWFLSAEWQLARNSGDGTWSIDRSPNERWVVHLDFDSVNGQPGFFPRDLGILGSESPYSLFVFVGDADAGFTILFERDPSQ